MSRLRLYWPDESAPSTRPQVDDDEPTTLPFRPRNRLKDTGAMDALARARAIHQNRRCPDCGHPVVEPLVVQAAISSRSNSPIPGTGTLVGFRCHGCDSEWPIQSLVFAFLSENLYAGNTSRLARDA